MGVSDSHWKCCVCGKDCFIDDIDYYMVRKDIWEEIGVGKGMLCMSCLEERLGHKLEESEIFRCPLTEEFNPYTKAILGNKN